MKINLISEQELVLELPNEHQLCVKAAGDGYVATAHANPDQKLVTLSLPASQVQVLSTLLTLERERILRDSPNALINSSPHSWADQIDDLYERFYWLANE